MEILTQPTNNTNYKLSAVFKWRISYPQKYKQLSQKHSLNYYYRNREAILEKQRNKYHQKQQQQQIHQQQH